MPTVEDVRRKLQIDRDALKRQQAADEAQKRARANAREWRRRARETYGSCPFCGGPMWAETAPMGETEVQVEPAHCDRCFAHCWDWRNEGAAAQSDDEERKHQMHRGNWPLSFKMTDEEVEAVAVVATRLLDELLDRPDGTVWQLSTEGQRFQLHHAWTLAQEKGLTIIMEPMLDGACSVRVAPGEKPEQWDCGW